MRTEAPRATPISAEWAIAYAFEPRYLSEILRAPTRQSRTGSRSASPFVSCWPTVPPWRVDCRLFLFNPGNDRLSHPDQIGTVPWALEGLTTVFGIGTGVSPPVWSPFLLIPES